MRGRLYQRCLAETVDMSKISISCGYITRSIYFHPFPKDNTTTLNFFIQLSGKQLPQHTGGEQESAYVDILRSDFKKSGKTQIWLSLF